MDEKNRELYLPLYGRAMVSRQGIIIRDPFAEKIWEDCGFKAGMKYRSKRTAYLAAIKARAIDGWVRDNALNTVINIGCGLDSRAQRIALESHFWFDVDSTETIKERQKYFNDHGGYKMLAADMTDTAWLGMIPFGGDVTVIMEGTDKLIADEQLPELAQKLAEKFSEVRLIADRIVPSSSLKLISEHSAVPDKPVSELSKTDRLLLRIPNASSCRLYEYRK